MELIASVVTTVSVVFLILEAMIIALAALIGYKRTFGITVVRAVYLLIIGLVSFFAGRSIAATLSNTIMGIVHPLLPAEIATILEAHPEVQLELLLENLVGALIVPFVFAALFGILQLLTLIYFKYIASRIVTAITKKEEPAKWSKWAGAGAGLLLGVVISAFLLSPVFSLISIVEDIPADTITIVEDAINGTRTPASVGINPSTTAMAVAVPNRPTTLSADISLGVSKFFPVNTWTVNGLTKYEIPTPAEGENAKESACKTLPMIMATGADALYAYNYTAKHGGTSTDAFTNAAAAVIPHLSDSTTMTHIASDAMCLVGLSFEENGSFMGIDKPASNHALLSSMIDNLIKAVARTTPGTVEQNMISLFGNSVINISTHPSDTKPSTSQSNTSTTPGTETNTESGTETGTETGGNVNDPSGNTPESEATTQPPTNNGFLSSMMNIDQEDPMKSLEDSAIADAVSGAIANLAENDEMNDVVNDIKDYAIELINNSEVNLADEKYDSLYEEISVNLSAQINIHADPTTDEKATIAEVSKSIEETVSYYFEEYSVPMDSFQTSVLSTCLAKEFYTEEYIVDGSITVTVNNVLDFFGITKEDLESGNINIDLPEDIELPEDFEIPEDIELPEDFEIPEDIELPEGFDPSDYLPETETEAKAE